MGAGILAAFLWIGLRPTPSAPGILEVNGRVEGDQAAVGPKVGGKIVRLTVREGNRLESGEIIAELASDQVQAQLEQAEHVLHTAREQLAETQARVISLQRQLEGAKVAVRLAKLESQASIGEAEAALGAARALLRQTEAGLEKAAKDYARYRKLFAKEAIAGQRLDEAKAAEEAARAEVEAARKRVSQADANLKKAQVSQVTVEFRQKEVETAEGRLKEARAAVATARARIQSAEASRMLAHANLNDTRVGAPFTGTVLKKLVEVGEVVARGTPLITLVDLSKLHAKVYVPEGRIGKVKLGDQARVYTDAFPNRYFKATVSAVSQQAEFTPRDIHMKDERVKQVFAVRLAIQNPQGILKPGMPVDARIRWNSRAPWGDGMD